MEEFKLLNPVFSGPSVSTPQLIFVHNPHSAVGKETPEEIVSNHRKVFFPECKIVLQKLVQQCSLAVEAAVYQKMLSRAESLLFIAPRNSSQFSMIPVDHSLEGSLTSCF